MSSTPILVTVSALLVLGAFAGCTVTSAAPSTVGAADGGASDGAAASASLTCLEIFQCAATCGTATDCADACLARGSADGKAAATNLAQCYQTNSCADSTCLQTKCSTELGACAATANASGTPVSTVPPAQASPAALVGKWHYFYEPNAATRDWTFGGDGTAKYYNEGAYDLPGGCKFAFITNSTGTLVVTGDTLTYYQTGGTQSSTSCGQAKTEPAPQTSSSYRWSIDAAGKLLMTDISSQNCIQNPLYDSCHKLFDRQ